MVANRALIQRLAATLKCQPGQIETELEKVLKDIASSEARLAKLKPLTPRDWQNASQLLPAKDR